MSTCIRNVVTATAAILALALLLPAPASAQNPPNCNANLLDQTIARIPPGPTAIAGATINYTVIVINRSISPPGCDPMNPNNLCTGAGAPFACCTGAGTGTCECQVGCDTLDVTADFCCPGPTGAAAMPPDPLCSNLVTDEDIPATDGVALFGPFPCVMPDIAPGIATAGVFGDGLLNDGVGGTGLSPFEINKTITVEIIPTTTTTSSTTTTTSSTTTTTSSTTTTTLPPLCLTRTPGFWGTHPFLIQSDDPRSLDLLPLTVCGTILDSVEAGSESSTTEAICSTGTDGKILGPQLTQLVRQCTAALLNVAASLTLEGDCTGLPDIGDLLEGCCGDASVCTGDTVPDLSVGACIERLDTFNNSDDTLNFPFRTGPANSRICRDARGNGVVVSPTP
jgi:hypothetical protein